jgi:hypothetical protein
VRGFLSGLLVGAVLGSGGLYLALERPWGRPGQAIAGAQPDAGAVDEEASEAGAKKGKRARRRRPGRGGGAGEVDQVIDEVIVLSAAERRPVWRGPAVELPPRDIDFESGGGGRSLNQGEINAGIASGRDAVSRCIGDARGNAELVARIEVKFLVEPDGRVSKVRLRAPSYLMQQGLHPCVTRAVRAMRFPATGAATVVSVPFDLS